MPATALTLVSSLAIHTQGLTDAQAPSTIHRQSMRATLARSAADSGGRRRQSWPSPETIIAQPCAVPLPPHCPPTCLTRSPSRSRPPPTPLTSPRAQAFPNSGHVDDGEPVNLGRPRRPPRSCTSAAACFIPDHARVQLFLHRHSTRSRLLDARFDSRSSRNLPCRTMHRVFGPLLEGDQ